VSARGERLGWLRGAAREMLRANWVEGRTAGGTPYAYTRPARRYPEQFFWDSCFHAVAWSLIDPEGARRELRTLLSAQRPDGFIGHTIFWYGRVRLGRRFTYNLMRPDDPMTSTIQPPLLAWAWAEVADRSPDDPGFRTEGLERILAYHAWLERERGDGDGLVGVLQPDETGMDATPAFDAPLGLRHHPWPGFMLLLRFNRARGYDFRRVVADGGFHAVDVLVNSALALGWSSLERLGHPGGSARAAGLVEAMVRRLWDPERGLFFAEGPDGAPLRVATWAGLAPLALDELPEDIGRRLVEEQLLDPARFWLPFPVPSTSAAEPSFRAGLTGVPVRRYWRGPTWLFATGLILRGLLRLGYEEAAARLVDRTAELIWREGFREYYDPVSGRGLGARGFSTSAMALDCAERVESRAIARGVNRTGARSE
jgi:Mannosylglycerate hydrolase MGH1-like glycoside hydrolase domain